MSDIRQPFSSRSVGHFTSRRQPWDRRRSICRHLPRLDMPIRRRPARPVSIHPGRYGPDRPSPEERARLHHVGGLFRLFARHLDRPQIHGHLAPYPVDVERSSSGVVLIVLERA